MTDSAALPDLLELAEQLPPELVPWEEYEQQVTSAWRRLVAGPEAAIERNLHRFLEHHPCMLPGFRSMTGQSGHYPYPAAVITEPKLPGLSTRRPDFCWIATDSVTINAVLIEIETPYKRWFVRDGRRRGEQHSDLIEARGQLERWKAWFSKPENQMAFLRDYDLLKDPFDGRDLVPHYVLVHGSRREFYGQRDLSELRRPLQDHETTMMTFDRLAPSRDAMSFGCVRITERGYEAVAVPPTFMVDDYHLGVAHLDRVIEANTEIADGRKRYLLKRLEEERLFEAGRLERLGNRINPFAAPDEPASSGSVG